MKTVLHFLIILMPSIGFCQANSTFPEIPYTDFGNFDIQGEKVIFTGDCGQIWHSTDLGETMQSYEFSTLSLYDSKLIPFDPENRAIVVAFRDVLLYDFEDGLVRSFKEDLDLISQSSSRYVEMDNKDIYLFTSDGIIHGMVDDYEWAYIYQDTSETDFTAVTSQTDNYIFIGMGNGRFLKFDKSTNEVSHQQDFGNRVSSLNMVNDNLGYAVISATNDVLKTNDGWATYSILDGMPEAINPIGYGEDIVLTVNTNRIYRSTDGGETSTFIDTKTEADYSLAYDAKFTSDGILYMVGEGSMFLRSDDYGETFTQINSYNRADFYDVTLESNGTGYAVGGFNTLVKTADNGATWSTIEHTGSGEDHYYYCAQILNDNKLFIGGSNQSLLLENDIVIETIDQEIIAAVYNSDNAYLIAIGVNDNNDYQILKSSDQGKSWNVKADLNGFTNFVSQNPGGRLFVPSEDGDVLISDDDGETWTAQNYHTERIKEITFFNDELGLVISGRNLLKTIDGGQTFTEIASGYALSDVRILSENHFIYTPRSNSETNISESIDGGQTFKNIFNHCSPTQDIMVAPDNKIIIAHEGGHINLVPVSSPVHSIDLNEKYVLNISPNPIDFGQNIKLNKTYEEVFIYSLNGKLLHKFNNTSEVNTSTLYSGTFVLKTRSNIEQYVTMFVVI